MRIAFAGVVVLACGLSAAAEDLKGVKLPARYGVVATPEFFGQATAKDALASASALMEKRRYPYLVAHLLDPAFVDAEVAARAKAAEPDVEKRLLAVRAAQQGTARGDTPADAIIPSDPTAFNARVKAEAEKEAFAALVKAIETNLSEFPENVTQLATIAREPTITEADATATAAGGVPNKTVYLKRGSVTGVKEVAVVGKDGKPTLAPQEAGVVRWYVEDRQADKGEPKKDK
jgi:hypothetical protein